MSKVTYSYSGRTIDYVPTTPVAPGDVIVLGSLISVAIRSIATGEKGGILTEGAFLFPKDSTVFSQGDKVYWDVATKKVLTTGSLKLGIVLQNAISSDVDVLVKINV